jgi:hypothetical protein
MIKEAIKTALETPRDSYKEGVAAKFARIDNTWGIKLYSYEDKRDHTYKLQRKASRIGAAPKIGHKFELKIPGMGYYYGYVTECIVKTYKDIFIEENGEEPDEENYEDYKEWTCKSIDYENIMYSASEYNHLIKALKKIHITTTDMHWANVGWLANGELVAIDFSEEKIDNSSDR